MSQRRAKIEYIVSLILFGTIGLLLRFVSLPSEVVALCRGLIGTVFFVGLVLVLIKRPDGAAIRENLLWLLLSGLCLGLNWIFLFAAYVQTTVAVASLCNYMAPILLIFLSPLLFRERLSGKKLLCVLAALLGIVFVSGILSGRAEDINGKGVLLGLAAALFFAGIVVCNKQLRRIEALDRTLVQLLVSALVILPYVLVRNRGTTWNVSAQDVWIILILGLVQTGLAYVLYLSPMEVLPVQTVSILGYIEPVVSVLCSAFLLREPLPWIGWLGAALIIGAAIGSERLGSEN